MMKFLTIIAITLCASLSSLHAQILNDSWTVAGNAWNAADQGSYAVGTGGVLYSDAAIAAGTNTALLNTNATLALGIISGGGGGLDTSFLYTANSTPAFTYSTSNVLSNLGLLTLTIQDSTTTLLTSSTATLSLGSTLASFTAVDLGFKTGGVETYDYTWNWNVNPSSATSFNIAWNTSAAHSAFTTVEVVQSVPEPSTWAMLAIGLGSVLWMSRRKLSSRQD